MGVHISIYMHGKEHPEWDSARYAGDRDFPTLLDQLPCVTRNTSSLPDWEPEHRPADFAAWRKAIAEREWPNPGRFEKMIDILEREPDAWVYIGW